MENIRNFLKAAEEVGVGKQNVFAVADLYEAENMDKVSRYLFNRSLGLEMCFGAQSYEQGGVAPIDRWTPLGKA